MAPAQDGGFAGLPTGAKIFGLALLLGLLTAIYYFALHMPLAKDIKSAEQQYDQLLQEEAEARQLQDRFHQLSMDLTQRQALDRRNKRVLPADAEMAAFLQDLNRLAELSGLRIHVVEPRPEDPQRLYVRLPVSLELSGRYHQVAKFFYAVSRLDRAINMENLELQEPAQQGEEVSLQVSVLATTFRRPAAAANPNAPAAPQGGGT